MKKNKQSVLNMSLLGFTFTIFPVFIGGLFYILWRPKTLVMFTWFEFIGILDLIIAIREITQPFYINIPDFLIYSIPNGLWIYSLMVFLLFLWKDNNIFVRTLIVFIGTILTVGMEFAQLFGIIKGVFCYVDIFISIIFIILSLLTMKIYEKVGVKDEN